MPHPIFERWQNANTMLDAEYEVIAMGEDAIPMLEDFFEGRIANDYGVPYRDLGLPYRCALETVSRLGLIARSLEKYLIIGVWEGHWIAASALGRLGQVGDTAVRALADALHQPSADRFDHDLATEAAVSIIRLGAANHPSVQLAREASERSRTTWARTSAYVELEDRKRAERLA